MYWIMDAELPLTENGEALLLVHNDLELGDVWSWKSGARFTPEECRFPVPISIEFERRRGYLGPPIDLLDVGVPIMSVRLHHALLDAGVASLDVYPAELVERDGAEVHACFAYNVIGRVSAVDVSKSEISGTGGRFKSDASIELLTLDESRIRGLDLFRLDENVNALVISQRVKLKIEQQGIDSVRFFRPEDWVQL